MEFAGSDGENIMQRWIREEYAHISHKRDLGISDMKEEQRNQHELQLPVFNHGSPIDWINQLEDFFQIFWLNEDEKLMAAALSMGGKALQWFEWEHQRRPFYEWHELKTQVMQLLGSSKAPSWKPDVKEEKEVVKMNTFDLRHSGQEVGFSDEFDIRDYLAIKSKGIFDRDDFEIRASEGRRLGNEFGKLAGGLLGGYFHRGCAVESESADDVSPCGGTEIGSWLGVVEHGRGLGDGRCGVNLAKGDCDASECGGGFKEQAEPVMKEKKAVKTTTTNSRIFGPKEIRVEKSSPASVFPARPNLDEDRTGGPHGGLLGHDTAEVTAGGPKAFHGSLSREGETTREQNRGAIERGVGGSSGSGGGPSNLVFDGEPSGFLGDASCNEGGLKGTLETVLERGECGRSLEKNPQKDDKGTEVNNLKDDSSSTVAINEPRNFNQSNGLTINLAKNIQTYPTGPIYHAKTNPTLKEDGCLFGLIKSRPVAPTKPKNLIISVCNQHLLPTQVHLTPPIHTNTIHLIKNPTQT